MKYFIYNGIIMVIMVKTCFCNQQIIESEHPFCHDPPTQSVGNNGCPLKRIALCVYQGPCTMHNIILY